MSSEEFSEEDNPPLDDSVESDDRHKLSVDYVLSRRCDLTEAQELDIHALVEKIRPEIPVFVVLIKKSNVIPPYLLGICKDYVLKYFPCEDTNIILQLPRRKKNWKSKLHIRPSGVSCAGRCTLYCGEFIRDNNVRAGDICLLQPMANVKQRRFTITVHLLHKASLDHSPCGRTDVGSNNARTSTKMASTNEKPHSDGEEYSSEYEDHGVSDDSEESSEPPFMLAGRACLTSAQEKKVLEKVEEFDSDLPFYVAIINKSNVHERGRHISSVLNFGSQYATKYLAESFLLARRRGNSSAINLVLQREGKRRSWPTELRHHMRHTSPIFRVRKGWMSFARDNHLREGDLCLFKMMKNEEPLKMMVYIIRREKC